MSRKLPLLAVLLLVSCSQSRPAHCDDPDLKTRFGWCQAATNADKCGALGGKWELGFVSGVEYCHCPTGQGGCPCTRPVECLGHCQGPLADGGCTGITSGACSTWVPAGSCFCAARSPDGGPFTGLCEDP